MQARQNYNHREHEIDDKAMFAALTTDALMVAYAVFYDSRISILGIYENTY